MKLDPYNHQQKYHDWKSKALQSGIPNLKKENSDKIINFILEMELGLNVSAKSVKGSRSPVHLNNLRQRMIFITRHLEKRHNNVSLDNVTEEMLFSLFNDMRNGQLKRVDGKTYQSATDFVKVFKSFWHWHMKANKKKGKLLEDITTDLDTSKEKPKWVYFTEDQFNRLVNNATPRIRTLMMFLYDTGIRAPTELMNIKVSDFYNDFQELEIRNEISKTFGRRIKLMLCSDCIKEFIATKKLNPDDFVFKINYASVNRSLKELARKVLGDEKSPAGQKYSELTMYDFRHNSCCYWLPRYKSESALMYRFGWKKSDKIHYYSELLGMKDTINEDDMLVDVTKTEIEKQLQKSDKEKEILQDRLASVEMQLAQVMELTKQLEIVSKR